MGWVLLEGLAAHFKLNRLRVLTTDRFGMGGGHGPLAPKFGLVA